MTVFSSSTFSNLYSVSSEYRTGQKEFVFTEFDFYINKNKTEKGFWGL